MTRQPHMGGEGPEHAPPRRAKQVIVMRKDLNMRKGKMVAQGAHASLGAVWLIESVIFEYKPNTWGPPYTAWKSGAFTKVCVSVDSEMKLLDVYHAAQKVGLPVKLITDAGHTEFHGVPTNTCLAIGPAWEDEIDPITSTLPLL